MTDPWQLLRLKVPVIKFLHDVQTMRCTRFFVLATSVTWYCTRRQVCVKEETAVKYTIEDG